MAATACCLTSSSCLPPSRTSHRLTSFTRRAAERRGRRIVTTVLQASGFVLHPVVRRLAILRGRMSPEKSLDQASSPPSGDAPKQRSGRSGRGTESLVAQLAKETRVDQMVESRNADGQSERQPQS